MRIDDLFTVLVEHEIWKLICMIFLYIFKNRETENKLFFFFSFFTKTDKRRRKSKLRSRETDRKIDKEEN